jgi:pimeloyl-ACP methyl ester carboxylesterase
VWEDRESRTGRKIALNIAIIPARARARESDPVVVLAGGPGQGAVSLAAQVMPLFARLNDARDIVLVDQRGTGESNPLDCDDEEPQALQALFEDTLPTQMLAKCLAPPWDTRRSTSGGAPTARAWRSSMSGAMGIACARWSSTASHRPR